ncbi:EthD family reductase [Jannaschia seohaensis]|uniref:Uncharacterized protein (TIGR02118 family) n=1 Tax=Jannaschia seohaensis TaxID=475081 RepID=A0A2Y9ACD9_9RHOB|nr:EthD family reductase [Jannaschia seohaensis]PWJ21354.1 uncharacterized protein (TIGR02118 family) [Jannaschia seohaensis]SSA41960.1 conserved hypothetical protein [Jannaschia seohaensis]
MTVTVQVLYPTGDGVTFDMDYYTGTHLPMVGEHWGPHMADGLITRGVASGDGGAPDFHAIATVVFADQAAMDAAMAAAGPLLEDIPNFYGAKPVILVGSKIG